MKLTTGEKVFQVFNYIFLTFLGILTLYPFWDVIRISLSTPAEVGKLVFSLWPKVVTTDAYAHVFKNEFIWIGYKNTIIRVILGVSIQLVVMTLFAYPLAKKNLPGRNIITLFVVFTMFFSGGLIPEYLLIKQLHLYNTIWSLVLPAAVPTFSMLIMRNYFMALPVELEESARIDGASELMIIVKIVFPLSVPIIATVALWGIVGHWNAWFDCLIYIDTPKKFMLQTILRKIIYEASPVFDPAESPESILQICTESVKNATIIVATVPIVCIYPFLQKYFIKGILVGSLKG